MKILDKIESFVSNIKRRFIAASTGLYAFGLATLFNRKRVSDSKLVEEGYASNSDAYAIIKRISEKAAAIRPIFELLKAGKTEELTDDKIIKPILTPLHMTSYEDWLFSCAINLLSSGDLFLFPSIPTAVDIITEYRVLESAAVEIDQNLDKEIIAYFYLKGTQQQERFEPDQIIHIKYADPTVFGIESKRGLSPLQAGYLTLTSSSDTEAAGAHTIKNKGAAGFISDRSDSPLDPKEYKKLQKKLNDDLGGAKNFNKIKVTTGDYKFVQLGMSPADLKLLENQVLSLRKMCNLYGTNSALYNDPANKTYSNFTTAVKAEYMDAILPVWGRIFAGIQKYLRDKGTEVLLRPDTSTVPELQADKLKEVQKNQRATESIIKISEQIAKKLLTLAAGRLMLVSLWEFTEEQATEMLQESDGIIIDS